eukprot:TRINITY_DN9034_c0_g1_i1.p1 TRINITY_DN9034_c0_g1~~TRINITY_DN9034_c0_g1_i1.p1  ORF type:complete len:608 (-),score=113.40 TRINITY_DN9034_c0_g1_i1:14-1837(-)
MVGMRAAEATKQLVRTMSNLDALGPLRKSMRAVGEEALVANYSWKRRKLRACLKWHHTESLIGAVIIVNFVVIIVEADMKASCSSAEDASCESIALSVLNNLLLSIYIIEAAVRIFVYRSGYFFDCWNVSDLAIVIVGVADLVMQLAVSVSSLPGVSMLRLFRVARLIRAAKLLRIFPELQIMMKGFATAIGAMMWGFAAIVIVLLMWSVLSVELLNEANQELNVDNEFCQSMFSSVSGASLMFFQTLVAGDSWGPCAIPLIEGSPTSAFLFAGSLVTVQLGLTNLILAVIVEKAQEAHESNKEEEAQRCVRERDQAEARFQEMCEEIDRDGNGTITLQELHLAYRDHKEMKAVMETLDIDEHDLDMLFNIMDSDGSGDLTYHQLVNCLHRSDRDDVKRQIMMLRLQIGDIWIRVRQHLEVKLDWVCNELRQHHHGAAVPAQRANHGTTEDTTAADQKNRDIKAAPRSPFAELRMQLDQLSQHLNTELTACALTMDAKEQELGDLLQRRGCGWEDAQHVWGVTHDDEIQASSPAVKQIQSAPDLEQNPGHNDEIQASSPAASQIQSALGLEQNTGHDDSLILQAALNGAAAASLPSAEHDEWRSYLK